jgi:hypothetical protein
MGLERPEILKLVSGGVVGEFYELKYTLTTYNIVPANQIAT